MMSLNSREKPKFQKEKQQTDLFPNSEKPNTIFFVSGLFGIICKIRDKA